MDISERKPVAVPAEVLNELRKHLERNPEKNVYSELKRHLESRGYETTQEMIENARILLER